MNFSLKVNLEVSLCLNIQLWSRDMKRGQKLKMKEIGELLAIYFVSINKLVLLKEDKHTLLSTFGMNVREV